MASNALAPTPTNSLAAYMQRQMGFDPNVERLSFLPYPQGALTKGAKIDWTNWVAPQVAYDAAKAYMLPGYAARGGQYDPEDVANMAMNVAGGGMAIGRAPANSLAMNVYHGTPHRFAATERNPLGEFRASQIGTGEGNQSYGHGLYLAEHPEVASGYKKRLSASTYIRDSSPVESGMLWHKAADAASEVGGLHPDNAGRIASEIMDWIDAGKKPETFLKRNLVSDKLKPAYEAAIGQYTGSMRNKGSLYHVDLPDPMIEKMLHWDKPLEEQSPYVQKIISEEIKRIGGSAHTGQQAYRNLMFDARMAGKRSGSQEMRGNVEAAEASKRLQELGIPGIQYFDAGSRGSGGTRNFVVFPGEEKNLTILKRE
jgi:hypothetical protein